MASREAEAASAPVVELAMRDVDAPLSALGEEQALALGRWFGTIPRAERPNVVLSSPYVRARRTAELIATAAELAPGSYVIASDERLREKEFGVLDRLTSLGIAERFPELSRQRAHVGKFYFRPPGGESWCDVILRLRSVLDTILLEHSGERVLIVGHQVIVNCLRYLLESLTEREILEIDATRDVPHCAVTSYEVDAAGRTFGTRLVNFVAPCADA